MWAWGPLVDVEDYRRAARAVLPRFAWDYLEGGAEDESAVVRNRAAFGKWDIVPRFLNDVSRREIATTLFGIDMPMPVMLAPTGLANLFRPGADVALAKAAKAAGLPFILSTAANTTVKEITAATGVPPWFQLYILNRERADILVDEADALGCPALVLTVDVTVTGKRPKDMRNGFVVPLKMTPRLALQAAAKPPWSVRYLQAPPLELPSMKTTDAAKGIELQAQLVRRAMDASFNWRDLARLRERWKRPLLVKGILSPDDALRCAEIGVDGIVVSNHGGRQLDGAVAALDALPGIAAAVGGRLTILFDSGIRRGEDVIKAMCLGAQGVLVGRPTLYGVSVAGESGASNVLSILRQDIDRTLALMGCPRLADLGRSWLRPTA